MTMSELRHRTLLRETEEKVKLLRMNWFVKNHEQQRADADAQTRPAARDSARAARLADEVRAMRAEVRAINAALERYRRRLQDGRTGAEGAGGRDDDDAVPETDFSYMYPVPPDVQLQLYTGASSNGEGRYRYLKTRNELPPDEKYRVCPTHSYKHGWNVRKLQRAAGARPRHGRTQVLKNAMYSVHGITLYDEHPTHRPPNFF